MHRMKRNLRIWREMSDLVGRMCWKIAAKKNQTVIWQKPLTNDCYMEREPDTRPPLCQSGEDPDAVWKVNMESCITPYSDHGPNTLKLIYDRGLIGSIHNWCEAFSTYPQTYDLLHAWTVFSDIEKKGWSFEDLLMEMDRILRPTGFVIIRDKQPVIDIIKKYIPALHWEAVATADSSSDSVEDGDNVVFIIQKKLWLTSESFRDTE
ncbi:S-adenosyl-L-methionine-dependent methyltransferases superfamily protein [Quillaja saponaria]|uniref:Methyltransferase n=1 Tax=Quillaja saponaria TaxID=32244 RepID=A0AAD7PGI1_QUISA|nr:S-adenosyl-L-methionine-dependent methyltransferases superfamily protein [Quillaja saponaria]